VGVNQHWRPRLILLGLATAVVPYATIPFDRWLERRELLGGTWRREATADPRDHTPVSRLLRFGLARPVLLASVLALGLVAVFTALLVMGPPGGKAHRVAGAAWLAFPGSYRTDAECVSRSPRARTRGQARC
jgi:hypothetical protein